MDFKNYSINLFGRDHLQYKDDGDICYVKDTDMMNVVLICNKNEHSMKIANYRGTVVEDIENGIERKVTIQLYEDGSRWEGDWYDGKPFGFGSIYDGEGNRIYSGFMFEGKKVGFGEEFFVDSHTVDYCGYFMNNQRHGWGCSYDRNGNKLYEGYWVFGRNVFDDKVVIEDNCEEDSMKVHNLIKELEIGVKCFNKRKEDLVIENYPNLEKIVVKKNSLKNLNSLKICNCEKLKTIEIEDGERWEENGAFRNVKNVLIESISILLFDIFKYS